MFAEVDRSKSQNDRSAFDREQYDILRRCSEHNNIAEWNDYRAKHPETRINLQNVDLRRARLEGAQLSGSDLKGARFEGADLLAADFRKADLRKANLEKANLWGATLSQANLEGARLASANLENADLSGANVERTDFRGANLEEAIIPEIAEQSVHGSKQEAEEVEIVINTVDDITFEEFISLMKCLEKLSLIVGGSTPHLNEIQISHHIEENIAWVGTDMDNMISINIPKSVADNLHGILIRGMTAGSARQEAAEAGAVAVKTGSAARRGIREVLADAEFSEDERKAVYANLALPQMQEDNLMADIGVVANLVADQRVHFGV